MNTLTPIKEQSYINTIARLSKENALMKAQIRNFQKTDPATAEAYGFGKPHFGKNGEVTFVQPGDHQRAGLPDAGQYEGGE